MSEFDNDGDRRVHQRFDIGEKEEDHPIAEIMKIYNEMTLEDPAD